MFTAYLPRVICCLSPESFICWSLFNMELVQYLVYALGFYVHMSSSLKVAVYYETLCPDSIAFINNQLHPNYEDFGEKYIQLELIPYGFAKETEENNTKTFTCQHGPNECYGNKVQGCVINSESVAKSEDFVYCSESAVPPASPENSKKCATQLDVNWSDVETCLSNGQADDIMEKNGKKTEQLKPNWIPTVVFNGVFNENDSKQSQDDFKSVVCKYLDNKPDPCRYSDDVNVILL